MAVIDLAAALCLTTSLDTVRAGATVRNAYAGVSNALGTLACDLGQAGFTPLEGGVQRIYGELLCDRFDPGVLAENLGGPYEIERGYFKRHACYRHAHAALDALDAILARGRPGVELVRAIRVQTYDFAARLTSPAPKTTLAAQFSIPHALAACYVLGHAGPEAFGEGTLGDPRIARLRGLVTVAERRDYTAMQPERRPATVELVLADGRVLAETVELPRGEPENPLSQAELEAKFLTLAGSRLGEPAARALCDALLAIAQAPDVRPVFMHAIGGSPATPAPAS
jgi:2-methylcitrate dehydratase PrpD